MKLYHSPNSPYVRKVMVTLHETGQLDEVELIPSSLGPFDTDAPLHDKNPLGKIPALERPDGPTLFDSRVICAWLDERAGGKLYPAGDGRWDVLTLEALADGMLDAALLITYEGRLRPEEIRFPDWCDAQWAKISRACAALESRWMSHLSGSLSMGQITVGCALGYLDFRHDARGWRGGCPALADWFADFESRASMQETRPPAA